MKLKISESWTGLCNQLFAIAGGIMKAKQEGINNISIGYFSPGLNSKEKVLCSKIIDLKKTGDIFGIKITDAKEDISGSIKLVYSKNLSEEHELAFSLILSKIQFTKTFYDITNKIWEKYVNKKMHVIHFRLEADGIKHWSNMNKMTEKDYESKLHYIYKELIRINITEGSTILALTYTKDHKLLKELGEKYEILCFDTEPIIKSTFKIGGRELCAIIDLLLGIKCNGTFIGCHNWKNKRGSTFSYTLWRSMKLAEQGFFIDLDDINGEIEHSVMNKKE